MSTELFEIIARACKPANVVEFPVTSRTVRHVPEHPHVYRAILVRDDVQIGELLRALRGTGIVISTDPSSGQTIIHKQPKGAA